MSSNSASSLNIIIVGAGLGGLSAAVCLARQGHNVSVLERANNLSEFGAGVQITPNAIRLLHSWGLKDEVEKYAQVPEASLMRRYDTGRIIGKIRQNPDAEEIYGHPYASLIYRPDFQKLLAEGARRAGAKIRFSAFVIQANLEEGTVKLEDNTSMAGDVVICADGVRSRFRSYLKGNEDIIPVRLDEYNYRATIGRKSMLADSETARLIDGNDTEVWMGPNCALVCYPISNRERFNVAVAIPRPSDAPVDTWRELGHTEEFHSAFALFCPLVKKIVHLVDECAKWTIAEVPSLGTWCSGSGKIVLLGDAAHAMSPHAAQGGAMAIEDAAVLGECILHFHKSGDLASAARAYEAIRRPRVRRVQEIARGNGAMWVLPDGPEQESRDRNFGDVMERYEQNINEKGRGWTRSGAEQKPDMNAPWPHPAVSMWLYGYDALANAREYLSAL